MEVTICNYTENFEEPRFLHLIVLSVNHKSEGGRAMLTNGYHASGLV